jgi:hypothetical protein
MYITFEDYQQLKYSVVPEAEFDRYNARAEARVRRYTFDRIVSMKPPDDAAEDVKRIAELNRRGVCEIIDICFLGDNPQSDEAQAKQVIVSFSNQAYSERYLGSDKGDAGVAAPEQMDVTDVINTYFTSAQRFRGCS